MNEAGSCGEASSCRGLVICGDAFRDRGEECDDGNTMDGDGCDSECRFEARDAGVDTDRPDTGRDAAFDAGPCGFDQSFCDGMCIPTDDDPMNCGDCGVTCGAGESCLTGRCLGDRRLEFVLSWDMPGDMDIHVVRPDGVEIFFGNRRPPTGPGGLDGDLDVDDMTTTGPERIGFDFPAAGDYIVCVNPYKEVISGTRWEVDVRERGEVLMSIDGVETTNMRGFNCTMEEAELVYSFTP